jgi:hypothetical protein
MTASDHLSHLQFEGPYDNGLVAAVHPEHGTVPELNLRFALMD